MKKYLSIFLSVLFILSFSVIFVGCGDDDGENTNKEEGRTDTEIYTATIADFETFEDIYNVQDVVSNYSFEGYQTKSSKEEAITGEGSLKWHITGGLTDTFYTYFRDGGSSPMLYYSLWYNTKNEGVWGFEWTQVTDIYADVRNDNEFDIQISMFYFTKTYFPVGYVTETISPGQTKTIDFKLCRYYMQNELNKTITHLCITCDYDKKVLENGQLYYPEADVFIDNIRATVDKTPLYNSDGSIDIGKKFAEKEILSFNDVSDLDYLVVLGSNYANESANEWATYIWFEGVGSSLGYNTNKNYIKEGNIGSLRWTVNPVYIASWSQSNYKYFAEYNYTYSTTWTGFTLCQDFLDYYNFIEIIEGRAKIAVDVYNACGYDKEVAFGMHDRASIGLEEKKDYPHGYNEAAPTDKWYKLKAGEWTTLEITDFSRIDFSEGVGRLRLFTSFIDVFAPMSFYVNNLRIVKI